MGHPELTQGTAAGLGELIGDLVEEATGEPVTMQPVEVDAAIVAGEVAMVDQLVGDGNLTCSSPASQSLRR